MRLRQTLLALTSLALIAGSPSAHAQLTLSGTSYSQSFDSFFPGLPTGWSGRTGSTATSLGSTATFVTANTAWGSAAGQFQNSASSINFGPPFNGSESAATQSTANNRLFAVRQSGGFGDPGAAFALQISNTLGLFSFNVSFEAHMLSVQDRSTTWTVDYGLGASPSTFIPLGSYSDPGLFGATNIPISFGSALDNQSGPVWIRIAALSPATAGTNYDTVGIDNFSLTYATVPEPSSGVLLGLLALPGTLVFYRRYPRKAR